MLMTTISILTPLMILLQEEEVVMGGSFVDGKMHKRSKDANIDANSINIAKGVRED
jgi:hypothetical protein